MKFFNLASLSTIALLVSSTVATSFTINDQPTKARAPPPTLITAKPVGNLTQRAEPNKFTNPNDFTFSMDGWTMTVRDPAGQADRLEVPILYYDVTQTNKKNGDAKHYCYKVDPSCWIHWKALWLNRNLFYHNCSYKQRPAGKSFDMCEDWTKKQPKKAWSNFDFGGKWQCRIVDKIEAEDKAKAEAEAKEHQ